jgi:hypothetical protein
LVRVALGPAHILGHDLGIERAEPVGRPILAGQHGKNTRQLLRSSLVDDADQRVRVRREDEDRVRLANEIDIRDIAPSPGQEAGVLFASDGLSDAEAHDASYRSLAPTVQRLDAYRRDTAQPSDVICISRARTSRVGRCRSRP